MPTACLRGRWSWTGLGRCRPRRSCEDERRGDEHHVAVFTLHHIAADGWSMGVLTARSVARRCRPPSSVPRPSRYRPWRCS